MSCDQNHSNRLNNNYSIMLTKLIYFVKNWSFYYRAALILEVVSAMGEFHIWHKNKKNRSNTKECIMLKICFQEAVCMQLLWSSPQCRAYSSY